MSNGNSVPGLQGNLEPCYWPEGRGPPATGPPRARSGPRGKREHTQGPEGKEHNRAPGVKGGARQGPGGRRCLRAPGGKESTLRAPREAESTPSKSAGEYARALRGRKESTLRAPGKRRARSGPRGEGRARLGPGDGREAGTLEV